MSPSPPGQRIRFVVFVVALQAAALVASARWMIRPIRADGGTWTEFLFFDLYSLVLALGVGSGILACGALARRLLGPGAERVAAVGLGALTGLALLADVAAFAVLGVHPYGGATWSAVSSADIRHVPGWAWVAAAAVVGGAVLCSAALWGAAGRLRDGSRWTRAASRLAWRIPVYFALGAVTFAALDRPDEERVVPRAALPFYGLWLGQASRFPDARPAYPLGSAPPAAVFTRRPDIVVVQVESWRWSIMTPEVMPFLTRLAASPGCADAQRDYAGGHLTQYGSFPLLYGIASYAFLPFMKEGRPSDPLTALRAAGYRLEAYDASGLLYYDTRPVLASQFDRYESPLERDSTVIQDMVAALGGASAQPRFVFGFLYSTHGGYNYPASFGRYPTSGLALGAGAALLNRYRNSAGYVDALLARLDSVLAPRLADGSAALVVTGDHGEEFGEHGVWAHAAVQFYDEETRVPLVLCFAGVRRADLTLSSHADVLPTLFDWMGAPGWDSTRLTGRSLLGPPRERVEAISGAGFPTQAAAFALATPAYKFWLHLTGPDLAAVALDRVTDVDDRPVAVTAAVRQAYDRALALYLREQRAVLRVN